MRAGDMDRRITIMRNEETGTDWSGHPIVELVEVATVWAQVIQQSGREFFAAARVQATRMVVFRLRWIDGITVTDTVMYDGRDHNIHEVRELGRKEGLELHTVSSG